MLELEPREVTLRVIDQVLVTSVKTRPLTLDEIREKGIVLDSDDYLGFEFSLALKLDSDVVKFTFPAVFDRNGVELPQTQYPETTKVARTGVQVPGQASIPVTWVPMLLRRTTATPPPTRRT